MPTLAEQMELCLERCDEHLEACDSICNTLEEWYRQPKWKRGIATLEEVIEHGLPIYYWS